MTLEQLKMLTLVAENGTLKQAANLMFKTQPAISQGIKQLESQLGIQLFSRQHYRLELTAEGQQIYQRATQLLIDASEIAQLSEHLAKGNEASITLSFDSSFDLNRLLPIIEATQDTFPDTEIIVKQENITGAIEALRNDETDIAISPADVETLEEGMFESLWLYEGSMVNVAAPRLLKRHKNLTEIKELRNEYQILIQDSGKGSKGKLFGVQPGQRRWYANDLATKKTILLSGIGWGHLPESLIEKELKNGTLVELNMDDARSAIVFNYYVMRLKSKVPGPVASQLWANFLLQSV